MSSIIFTNVHFKQYLTEDRPKLILFEVSYALTSVFLFYNISKMLVIKEKILVQWCPL